METKGRACGPSAPKQSLGLPPHPPPPHSHTSQVASDGQLRPFCDLGPFMKAILREAQEQACEEGQGDRELA